MAKYFGTNGIRGKADFLTPEFVSQICSAYGTWIKGGKIVVGRDCRLNGVEVQASAIKGLLSVGCEVVDLGVAPSPTVEFAVRNLGAASGLTVTASHNPPEWNGLKFTINNGVSLTAEKGEEVEEIYESKKFHFAKSSEIKPIITYNNAIRDHLDAIKKHINAERIRARNPLLVLDCGNGTACASTPLLFKELGCRVIVINGTYDGHFPGRPSEPKKETLGELMARVQSEKADLGIAWDGDADRVAFIDEKGDYLSGSESFALSAIISLRERGGKGTVISTVSTSNVVKEVAEKNGGTVILTKVGSPYIAEKIAADSSVVVGGEDTGGTFWPELSPTKDGLMTAAKIVEELCVSNKPMSQLVAALPKYYVEKANLEFAKDKAKLVEGIKQLFSAANAKHTFVDGSRMDFSDGSWIICRPSGTENLVRIFVEAKSEKRAKELISEYREKIEQIIRRS